ncbi:MAG: response regulator [Myxococcota bacterium]
MTHTTMAPEPEAGDAPRATVDEPINILLVDDQPGKLLGYQAILGDLGETLLVARSAREALELLLKQDVALILIDVVMPELDGFELAEMIRSHPRFEKVAMMFVSGVQHSDLDRIRGYSAGAVDFVAVPVVPEILRAKVRVFADLYRKTRQLESLNRELEQRIALRTADLAAYSARMVASEERLRLALASARAGAWEWRFASGEVTWSPEVYALLGRSQEAGLELRGMLEHVHADDRERVRLLLESLPTSSGRFELEYRVVPHGAPWEAPATWLRTTGEVVTDPAGVAVAARGIHQDVTTRKRAELELEQEARRKDEFLATLAHELRNPLAPIASCVQMMRRGELGPELREKNRMILDRQVSHLVRLVDDLLDVSRVSRGAITLDLQHVDLAEVVRSTLDAAALRSSGHTIVVDVGVGPGPKVAGDAVRLAQVLSNLVANAVKFTPPDGRIEVTLVDSDPVELTVRDTGRGIAAADLERVFEMFVQVAPDRSSQGLGIGLSLARRLVELHQGSIVARSEGLGRGTAMVVRLPRVAPAPAPEVPRAAAAPSRLRVLIIDDNADAADILTILLELEGHEPKTAYDGLSGIALGEAFEPDIVLLDLGMPGIDGYETARRIRLSEWGRRARLVALTGWGQASDRQRTAAAGFDGHLVKPVEQDALVAELRPR